MKKTIKNLAIIAFVACIASSFTTLGKEKKDIKTDKSKIVWKGYKVTGSHEGTIALKSGALLFEDNKLVGGEFVMDMQSIVVTDLSGGGKGKLEGHLKSDDFFGVAEHPTALLIFKDVKAKDKNVYNVTADLTIKGKTNTIDFIISVEDHTAKAKLKINRTDYGVKYKSASFFEGLKDKAISDEFDLISELEF